LPFRTVANPDKETPTISGTAAVADRHPGWCLLVDAPRDVIERDVMPVDRETGKPMGDGH